MKMLLFIVLLFFVAPVMSAATLQKIVNSRQQGLVRIINPDNKDYTCEIRNDDYSYYISFKVRRLSKSQWYFEPVGAYVWRCW